MAEDHDLPFKMSRPPDMDDDPQVVIRLIVGPANALLITACLALALNCVSGIAWNALTSTTGDPPRPLGMTDDEYHYHKLGKTAAPFLRAVAISIPTLSIYPLAILGALRMKQRKGYRLALVSSFLVMLPCSVLFLVGILVGCWVIMVLKKPEVRRTFV